VLYQLSYQPLILSFNAYVIAIVDNDTEGHANLHQIFSFLNVLKNEAQNIFALLTLDFSVE
jgi:hypothetical protein